MCVPSRRLLLSVEPRVLHDSLLALARASLGTGIVGEPDAVGPFDVALVSAGRTADATVVIELLADGGCVVVRSEGQDRMIELRDATGLLSVLAEHLGIDLRDVAGGDVERDPGPSAGCGLHGERSAH